MAPSSFVFLNLAPTSSGKTPTVPRRPSSIHNPFLNLSPTTSAAPATTTVTTTVRASSSASVSTSPSSRHNSIDFLSLAPISSPITVAPANVLPGSPRGRRSSSMKSDGSSSSSRFLKLSPVVNGREDEFAVDA